MPAAIAQCTRRRWSWMTFALLMLGCRGTHDPAPSAAQLVAEVRVTKNGDLRPGLPVRFQPFETPELEDLRAQENLLDVVEGARDEFDRILLVKDWVAAQWPHGVPDPYPPWNALVILDWIRSGKTGGFCGQYSQVLLQSLAALGMTARYVELGSVDNPYAHFVIEVWSNQFDKWVVMDADYNVHYERLGVPLSALEIHDALLQGQLAEVDVLPGPTRDGHPDPFSWPDRTAELFYYVRLHLKADHLAVPDEPPFDRYNDMVDWTDELTVPWESSAVESPYLKERLTNLQSAQREDFLPKLNHVFLTIGTILPGQVTLHLRNNVFEFRRYEVRETTPSDGARDWRAFYGNVLIWEPVDTGMSLEIRGVNSLGFGGPPSVIEN